MKLLVEWSDGTVEELSADVVEFAADPDVEEEGGPIAFLQSLQGYFTVLNIRGKSWGAIKA